MKGIQRIRIRAQGRAGRFLLTQLAHAVITVLVLSVLLVGAARAGALNGVLRSATQSSGGSFTTVNYQGRLADSSGNPVDNSNPGLGMTFALYDADTGGSPLWSETHANVPVSQGLFSVRLGSVNALSTGLLSGDRWLGVQVGTDPEMTPREKLAAVPYAMVAGTVPDGSITTAKIADGAVTSGKLDTNLCCGHTDPNGTGWVDYGSGIYIDVNTSACNFSATPMYFTSFAGTTHHWRTTGATSIYSPSASGFRVYVSSVNETLDPAKADSYNWHIHWCGLKK